MLLPVMLLPFDCNAVFQLFVIVAFDLFFIGTFVEFFFALKKKLKSGMVVV